MTKIVETKDTFESFYGKFKNSPLRIVIPVPLDLEVHPARTETSFYYVKIFPSGNSYILSRKHRDCGRIPDKLISKIASETVHTLDSKYFHHISDIEFQDVKDVNILRYLNGEEKIRLKFRSIHSRFQDLLSPVKYMPIYHFTYELSKASSQVFTSVKSYGEDINTSTYERYVENVYGGLMKIEKNGIYVDKEEFLKHYENKGHLIDHQNLVYSEYDIFTSTGRPSNAFGGVNYAAINKDDKTRKSFKSRFENGSLLMFDYDAFHLRLIAGLVDYKFPQTESVHEYMGRQYFNTDDLSKNQYEESKKLSFRYLYGSTVEKSLEYEFFEKVEIFKDKLWDLFQDHNVIMTPFYHRKIYNIDNPSPAKIFNYLLQSYETEFSSLAIRNVLEISNEEVVPCLYTYDSLLFDVKSLSDDIIRDFAEAMEIKNQYVKAYVGKNYEDLEIYDYNN